MTEANGSLPSISDADFALTSKGMSGAERTAALKKLKDYLGYYRDNFLGYQVNQDLRSVAADLPELLKVHSNNIGDPFTDSNLMTHTKPLERAVLAYYAELWGAEPYRNTSANDPEELETAWGYVLSMGSSEGNVYGLLNARDYLTGKYLLARPHTLPDGSVSGVPKVSLAQAEPPKDNPNAHSPVIFFSHDTHYSVAKAAHTLNIPSFGEVGNRRYKADAQRVMGTGTWPKEVPSTGGDAGPGTIDVDKLVKAVDFFGGKGHPVVLVLNLGSTFKGAYDDVEGVLKRLGPVFTEHGMNERTVEQEDGTTDRRNAYWIHVDGALGANYLPFLRMAQDQKLVAREPRVPAFDFRLSNPGIHSIVSSGHKYPGSPWPCGVFMTRRKYQLQPPPLPAYVGSPDTTFAGSRNGFSAAVLWNFFAQHSYADQVTMVVRCHDTAVRTAEALRKVDEKLRAHGKEGLDVELSPHSLSVRFRMPAAKYVRKYSLANVAIATGHDTVKHYSHLFTMPHVTDALIKELVADLMREDAFPQEAEYQLEQAHLVTDMSVADADLSEVVAVAMDRGFA
ncbi:PLP-dependent aminotransferase family protein [Nocardiopsis aegyptia]|uniref:Histidine decarboxylase n=1 Tax=Nocardiopsis aegyptia TaxID=220378 RepID=A0A7Z0EIG7_9ACTN|nr:hypothetical protein [Nocardiopsis aegyptia]NYJ32684.1 histidine decarboxylase [Nocardiopsis aegyptia]